MMRCQVYVDPLFGSERYIEFEPDWVAEAEDKIYRVTPWRKYPVTSIQFKSGRQHLVMGHWAEQIKAAQQQAEDHTPGETMQTPDVRKTGSPPEAAVEAEVEERPVGLR